MEESISKPAKKTSKWFLVLGGLFVLLIIIAIVGGGRKETPGSRISEGRVPEISGKAKEKINELKVGDVLFKLIEAKDRGKILKASESRYQWDKDLTTEGKFIEVKISAENKWGREEIGMWGQSKIIDSQGREFGICDIKCAGWLPKKNECIEGLKPGFGPKVCTEIYEVAPDSSGLKVRVFERLNSGELDLGI
jgi:hypothetical protein